LRDHQERVALFTNFPGVDTMSGKVEDKFVERRVRCRADIASIKARA
jgi:hypothetical protein